MRKTYLGITLVLVMTFVLVVMLILPAGVIAVGSDWSLMESGTSQTLTKVWGTSATDVFAVGIGGIILHYDGSNWTQMNSNTNNSLRGVWGSSGSDVFAVGYYGTILHYNGSYWSKMNSNTDDCFMSVWGSASDDVFAVTQEGTIYHYDGDDWSKMNSPLTAGYYLSDIWGSASNNVYITCTNGKVYHYNGSSWAQEFSCPQMLRGIWGSGPNDIIVVGRADQIYRYDGDSWNKMIDAASGYTSIGCIGGRASDDVYIGGNYGAIYKYDGSNWTRMSSSSSQSIIGLWFDSGSEGFAVSGNGAILHTPVERYEVNGTWTVTSVDGGGTFDYSGNVTSGVVNVGVSATGDIQGEFDYICTFYPGEGEEGEWHGTSASISGTVTVDGIEHPGTLWLKGYFKTFSLIGFPPTSWQATLGCPQGETHGLTTDGSQMAADFGWTGSCEGDVSVQIPAMTWSTSSGNGAGTWDGISNTCLAGKTQYEGTGYGQVSLPMSPEEVTLDFNMDEPGDFILTRYDGNPGAMPGTKSMLNRFAQVDSSVVSPEFHWGETELQIEYTDEDITAATLNEDTLALYWWNSGSEQWEEVPGSWGDPEENYVWGSLEHFSIYSIQGDPLVIYSCDETGIPKNKFYAGESIYVTGEGLDPNTDYRLWLQPPGIMENDELIPDDDFSEEQELVTTDDVGHLNPTEIWAIFDGLSWEQFEFSIVADNLASGTEGYYNSADDESDSVTVNGLAVYVDQNAVGGNEDGTSWGDAYLDLQDALFNIPGTPCQIWVAAGTYTPGTNRTDSFQLQNNVEILGGFFSGEGDLSERDWENNVTVLSGDIGVLSSNFDNCLHVVFGGTLNGTAVLDGFTITEGNANSIGANARVGAGMLNINSSPTISNCIFSNNVATYDGAGMYNYQNSSPLLTNCTFLDNESTSGDGGGICNYENSSPLITDCTFSANIGTSGGGMYNYNGSSPTVIDSTFSNNSATWGAGMYNTVNEGTPVSSSPIITDCIFDTNIATSDGGGIYNYKFCSPIVSSGTFSDNLAGGEGGGIYNYMESSITVFGCTFFNNSADYGGGMYNDWYCSPITVSESIFFDNSANDGGGIYNFTETSLTVSNSDFLSNDAISGDGGGIYLDYALNTKSEILGCTFDGNTAIDYGGGIYNEESGSITDCNFSGNSSPGYGGGIYTWGASPEVTNCIFEYNSADYGGGMYNEDAAVKTINCIFNGNTALSGDAAICNDGAAPVLTNCVFYDNTAPGYGGAIGNWSAYPVLTNCIIWGNSPVQIYDDGGGTPVVTYCDVQGGYGIPADNNISGTPMWVNPGSGDFHLQASSPCIDSGSNSAAVSITEDFEGDARIIDGNHDSIPQVDMGVDEYIATGKMVEIYVTLQGAGRPDPAGWQIPLNVGFYPEGSPNSWLLNPGSATYYFSGTCTKSGTRTMLLVGPVNSGTYDITADSTTTLLNVKKGVGIW